MKFPSQKHSPVPGCWDTDRPHYELGLVDYDRGFIPDENTGPCTGYLIAGTLYLLPHDLQIGGEPAIRAICKIARIDRQSLGCKVRRAVIDPLTLGIIESIGYDSEVMLSQGEVPIDWKRIRLVHPFYGKAIPVPNDMLNEA